MDWKCCRRPRSKFRLNKFTLGVHGEADRISQLPDEIIIEILSFLPLREAVATSILSSRWTDLWKHTCTLDFNTKCLNFKTKLDEYHSRYRQELMKRPKYIEIVNSVLQSHKALSLNQFRISLYVDKSAKHTVAKWLEFVFARRVESLALDFQTSRDRIVLKELLRESKISLVFFKSLKSLCLKSLRMSGEDIKLFLANCPLLERLIIRSTYLDTKVEVCGASATLVLNHLDATNCSVGGLLRVSAPNLTWLGVDSKSRKLLLENNSPKLVGASFVYSSRRERDAKRFTSSISCYISQLKILNLTLCFPQVVLASGIPEFPNLNKLVVNFYGRREHSLVLPVTALISACPRLEEFEIEFIESRRGESPSVEAIANVERCPHQHLKVFKFRRLYGYACKHYELVRFVSNYCVALQKISIDYELCYLNTFPAEDSGKGQTYIKQQLQGKIPHRIQLHLTLIV